MTLGEKIAKQRKELNFTQEQLADTLGVSRQSVSKWESDIAYPETEKPIKMGKLFDCSMDYLLNEDIVEKQGTTPKTSGNIRNKFKKQFRERKSEKTVFGLLSSGIFSLGLLSMRALSVGLLSLGLISIGVFSAGVLAVGSVALGLFAVGAISVGVISFGALSVGCFSSGTLAIGKYVAVGDHAHGMIAIGESVADGTVYSHIGSLITADTDTVVKLLDENVPQFLCWAKEFFILYLL